MISEDWNELGMTFLSAQENGSPQTLLIEIRSPDQQREDAQMRLAKGPDSRPRMVFPSYELFYKLLSPNRLQVLTTMAGVKAVSIRALARQVGRDFKGVHTDVAALLRGGLIERTEDGAVQFPFAGVHIDLRLGGEAQSAA
jgi:predicted transcriptional regulator